MQPRVSIVAVISTQNRYLVDSVTICVCVPITHSLNKRFALTATH